MEKKITLYDTTLRDGAQTEGISYSVNDKVRIAKKLDDAGEIVIFAKAGEAGKLFGRVTAKDVTEKINSQLGIDIDRKEVLLKRAISDLGEYEIKIKLHNEVIPQIKLVIKNEE